MIRTFGCTLRYISAAAVVHGPTVLEPSAVMLPLSFGAFFAVAVTAVTPPTSVSASAKAPRRARRLCLCMKSWLPFRCRWIERIVAPSRRGMGHALVNLL